MKKNLTGIVWILFFLSAQPLFATETEAGRVKFAKKIVQDATSTDWSFEKSYMKHLCQSHKKALMKPAFKQPREAMKEQWQKGSEYGEGLEISSVQDSGENQSIGYQVDVVAKSSARERPVTFRFWIDEERSGKPCMSGFNFFSRPSHANN
jgi:hypothetical protein